MSAHREILLSVDTRAPLTLSISVDVAEHQAGNRLLVERSGRYVLRTIARHGRWQS
jgi:hypothetical protein